MIQQHLDEREIELLASAPESLGEGQRDLFLSHIADCSLCGQHFAAALEFYSALKKNLERGPSEREEDLARRISRAGSELMLAFRGLQQSGTLPDAVAEITNLKPALATRLVRLVAAHPVKAGASFAGMIALSLFLATMFRDSDSRNVEYVKIQDGLMKVYDIQGDVIWEKVTPGFPNGSTVSGFFDSEGRRYPRFIVITDVHPELGREVLFHGFEAYGKSDKEYSTDTLYCFSGGGDLLWKRSYSPREFESFNKIRKGKWRVSGLFTVGSSKGIDRVFVFVYNAPFSPCVLMEIVGATGSPIQTYAHFGYMTQIAVAGSGEDTRILAGGINNSFNQAFLAVLDPDALSGIGPTAKGLNLDKGPPATEMYYLLFPRSELSDKLSMYPYNGVGTPIMTFEDGSFVLTVDEFDGEIDSLKGAVLYSFDTELGLRSVTFSDPLLRTYDLLSRAGKKFRPLNDEYAKTLGKMIRYWDGDKFVSTPTRNRTYVERMNLP